MKIQFLLSFYKINMPTITLSLLRRDHGGAAAPYGLFFKSVIGCNPTAFPVPGILFCTQPNGLLRGMKNDEEGFS
jgi:hypothetical protein